MTVQKIRDWLEIVGLFSVVASLIFVGLQMKQTQDIALAASFQARTTTLSEGFNARAANADALAAELRVQGRNPQGQATGLPIEIPEMAGVLTELEYRAGLYHALAMWQQWNNIHYQEEMGFMPAGNWSRVRSAIKRNFKRKTLASLTYDAFDWRPEFEKEIDAIIAEVEAEKSQ